MAYRPNKVVQCDLEGKDLLVFVSAKEAAFSLGKNDPSKINKAIRHGYPLYGYRWRYLDSPLIFRPTGTPGRSRRIAVTDLEGNYLSFYPSLATASKETGIGLTAIENALLTGNKAKGYRFYYEEEGLRVNKKDSHPSSPIVKLDANLIPVGEYASAKEAAKELGVHVSAIYNSLNDKNGKKKCKGHYWRYKDGVSR